MAKRAKKTEETIFERVKREANEKQEPKQDGQVEVPGLRKLVALRTVIKALEALETTQDEVVKTTLKQKFIERGMQAKHQPKSFTGYEGDAEANCQLRKQTSRHQLSEAELDILRKHNISVKEEVQQEEQYVVAEKYLNSQKDLKRASDILTKGGFGDFFELQRKKFHYTVTDKSIEEVFSSVTNADDVSVLLDIVGTLAMRITSSSEEMSALEEVLGMLRKKDKK